MNLKLIGCRLVQGRWSRRKSQMHDRHEGERIKMNVSSISCLMLVTIVMMLTKCTAKSKLSLWIDAGQVDAIAGKPPSFHSTYNKYRAGKTC